MNNNIKFWDGSAKKYSLKPVPSQKIYDQKLKKTREYLNSDSLVLEFGCGTGTTALIHAPYVRHIEAYDFSSEMIKIANEKKQSIINVSFQTKAIEEIDFKKDHYDMIMAHSVLHLTFGNEETLKKVFQSLKKGGVFVSGTACLKNMPIIRLLLPLLQLIKFAPDLNVFSADDLIELHQKIGFSIEYKWHYKKGEIFLIAKKP